MAVLGPSEERRLAICDWLTANSIDPSTVPLHSELHVETKPNGTKVIRYEAFVTEEGRKVASYTLDAIRETREAPLLVEPPEHWPA
jgi:hypothetical protein